MNPHDATLRRLFTAARQARLPEEAPPGFATRVLTAVRAARRREMPFETLALRFLGFATAATALAAAAILVPTHATASADEAFGGLDPVAEVIDAF